MSLLAYFEWPVRVYYEDTDAGGIVYYANYLKFMERARTEWLRSIGIDLQTLADQNRSGFVVRSANLAFMRPARLSDALTVSVELKLKGKASVSLMQQVQRSDEILCKGEIRLAYIDLNTMRPCALPDIFS
ncbi:tol-pal system-associated acyl-CoA thioesterase [Arenicellales bacterium IMCC55707]|jgi:acyl-CoA thioester hydrolase